MNNEEIKDRIKTLYEDTFGERCEIRELKGGGSTRKYFRLTGGGRTIAGVYCDEIKENLDFINLQGCLHKNGIKVPEIYKISEDSRCYLIEDLGDNLLLSELTLLSESSPSEKIEKAEAALSKLLEIQTIPEEKWFEKTGHKPFSERLIKWDLNYFKYDFLKPAGIHFDEDKLEDDFEALTKELTGSGILCGLMYRDFQSRNIMLKDGELYFIDFQGARKGPMVYDAVSFIWQAKAPFTYEERARLEDFYLRQLAITKSLSPDTAKALVSQMEDMQVFRTLQVLGAYGFRGLIEGKSHFKESLAPAIRNLKYSRIRGRLDKYPEIQRIADALNPSDFDLERTTKIQITNSGSTNTSETCEGKLNHENKLTVKVSSFSYKKGYPGDNSGNGGGFMFDCRGMHNPGRYQEYKDKTGKDKEVAEFLEKRGEVFPFIEGAFNIVKPTIERYIDRGFTSLQVGFGCTGGQHRSVYCAENFVRMVKERYPQIKVELTHREFGDWR